jgi:Cys-rich four helix bundle protein (predicted Tat secretion target)
MDRRTFVVGSVSSVAVGLAVTPSAVAQAGGNAAPARTTTTPGSFANPKIRELFETSSACVRAGEICQQHCLEYLSKGDESMARCANTLATMLPMCRALDSLALQGSPHLADLAKTCAKVCRDCEAACKVHANHHEACKQCMETCSRCAGACEKFTA